MRFKTVRVTGRAPGDGTRRIGSSRHQPQKAIGMHGPVVDSPGSTGDRDGIGDEDVP
jgi:hypothetical protein